MCLTDWQVLTGCPAPATARQWTKLGSEQTTSPWPDTRLAPPAHCSARLHRRRGSPAQGVSLSCLTHVLTLSPATPLRKGDREWSHWGAERSSSQQYLHTTAQSGCCSAAGCRPPGVILPDAAHVVGAGVRVAGPAAQRAHRPAVANLHAVTHCTVKEFGGS